MVLSRRKLEELIIGEGENRIVVTVLELRPGQVRLGISAPKNVPVHRREVAERLRDFKDKAPEMVRPLLPPEPFTQR